MSKQKKIPENEPFIEELLKHFFGDHNRGNRAELRRYWSNATRHYAWPHLGKLNAISYRKNESITPEGIIAALYAENPSHKFEGMRLGQAALKLAGGSQKSDSFEAFERHFRRLLSCEDGNYEELGYQMYRLCKRMKRDGIALDFNQLLWDLRNWRNKAEKVKTDWARDFYQAPSDQELQIPTPTK